MSVSILVGDVRARLAELPADHFDCVLTSPPYWGLRSYLDAGHPDKHLEIGCEPTLGEHLEVIVGVMNQVRRVLKPTGVCWLNYGDCYATSPNGRSAADTKAAGNDDRTFRDKPFSTVGPVYEVDPTGRHARRGGKSNNLHDRKQSPASEGRIMAGGYMKPKDLCLIPQRLAIALQENGWWVRSLLPWVKRNGMPESINDRPASSIEYVIMLTKSARYAYDAESVRRPASPSTNARVAQDVAAQAGSDRANGGAKTNGPMRAVVRQTPKSAAPGSGIKANTSFHAASSVEVLHDRNFRNSDLFFDSLEPPFGLISNADGVPIAIDVCPQGFKEAHFACVDDQTDALTPSGWKRHQDLADGDTIAAYDSEAQVLRWQPATFHRYQFSGELVAINKRDSSQRLTPKHRCIVRRRSGHVTVVEAADLKPGMEVPVTARLEMHETEGPGQTFAALLGWYLTEGERRRHNRLRITQSTSANPEKVAAIRALLTALGADVRETERQRLWRGRPANDITFSIGGEVMTALDAFSPDKSINPAWIAWPAADIRAFLDAVIDGDGHRRPDGRTCVIQKDRLFLDRLQAMALRLGWRGHVAQRADGGHCLYLTKGTWLTLRATNGRHEPIGREAYEGTVWCPSVESTFWLARRDGKTFITGNTFPEALALPLLRAGNPARGPVLDPFGGAGTVGLVADRLGMNATLIELNEESAAISQRRITGDAGMFSDVEVAA